MDNIEIDGSKWIWIDHCSLGEDPWIYDKVQTPVGELPWVTYDGVVDIGKSSDFVTVSWCHFQNHDKTMLIGYGANFINDAGKLHVTVHNNIFENCKGRLPLVRYGTVHVYKNKYFCDDKNKSGFCIGVGYASKIFAEENHFSECKYGFRKENATSTDNDGKIFYINNVDGSSYYDSTRKAISENIGWNPQNSYIYKF
jgi:pectate lyase